MDERFQVVLQPEAIEGMESAYHFIEAQSPNAADKWLTGLIEAVESLASFPNRCPVAPENDVFEREIRQLLYGRRNRIYRILFTIDADTVHVLHIRHGSQRWLEAGDV